MAYVDFSRLKRAVPIRRVLDHYGLTESLKRQGADLRGPCPVHQGSNPTQFSVDPEKSCWRCFTCGAGGTILDLVAALERVDLHEAGLRILEWSGVDAALLHRGQEAPGARRPSPVRRKPAAPRPSPPLTFRLTLDPEHPYLAERGLSPETVAAFGLGYCSRGILAGRIAIPIHDAAGRLIAYAGRWPGEPPPERMERVTRALVASIDSHQPPTFRSVWGREQHEANAALSARPNEVRIDDDLSAECAVVEVFTIDRRGLLYQLASALHELGLIIRFAKISTALDQVVDVFYVAERDGTKPRSAERLDEIRRRLMEIITPG